MEMPPSPFSVIVGLTFFATTPPTSSRASLAQPWPGLYEHCVFHACLVELETGTLK